MDLHVAISAFSAKLSTLIVYSIAFALYHTKPVVAKLVNAVNIRLNVMCLCIKLRGLFLNDSFTHIRNQKF